MALQPVEIQMDASQIQQLSNEWKEVENAPLPDDEDEDFKWWFAFVFKFYSILISAQNLIFYLIKYL